MEPEETSQRPRPPRHEAQRRRRTRTRTWTVRSPRRGELAALEHAESRVASGDIPIVEEERASVRLLETRPPRSALANAPERRELRLEEGLRKSGAILRQERPPSARSLDVDRARDQLLPGAALAQDQDGQVGGGDPLDQSKTFRMPGTGRSGPNSVRARRRFAVRAPLLEPRADLTFSRARAAWSAKASTNSEVIVREELPFGRPGRPFPRSVRGERRGTHMRDRIPKRLTLRTSRNRASLRVEHQQGFSRAGRPTMLRLYDSGEGASRPRGSRSEPRTIGGALDGRRGGGSSRRLTARSARSRIDSTRHRSDLSERPDHARRAEGGPPGPPWTRCPAAERRADPARGTARTGARLDARRLLSLSAVPARDVRIPMPARAFGGPGL
jgi:hypothetical protein